VAPRHDTTILYNHIYDSNGTAELEAPWAVQELSVRQAALEVGLTCFRVGLYWKQLEGEKASADEITSPTTTSHSGAALTPATPAPAPAALDFRIVDCLMDFLADLRRETGKPLTVVLIAGMKAPAWPEFYLPARWEAAVRGDRRHGCHGADVTKVAGLPGRCALLCPLRAAPPDEPARNVGVSRAEDHA
jgi:hypothetical protein